MPDRRSVWYRSGDAFLPTPLRTFLRTYLIGGPASTFYITYWSIVHLLSGILFATLSLAIKPFSLRTTLLSGFAVHTLWEVWQIAIGMSRPLALSGSNNFVDICMDTLLFLLGIWLVFILQDGGQDTPVKQPFSFFRR